jgi:putative ABC transport system permease protein
MLKITLKGIRAHKIRFLLTTVAVIAGVAFVVGSFTLTDSVRAQFNQLFTDINANIDLTVRSKERFDVGPFGVPAPLDENLLPQIQQVDDVEAAQGTAGGIPALVINPEGEALTPIAGPPLGVNWGDEPSLSEQVILEEGARPSADDEVAFDKRLFKESKYTIGDTVTVQTMKGNGQYRLVGSFSFGENNATAGAYLVAFTTHAAQEQYNLVGKFQEIQIGVADGADVQAVEQRISAMLPDGVEVAPTEAIVEQDQENVGSIIDIFGTVLLVFAGISLFVAAFLIFNVFLIVVGQRVRELALLRAVGATGGQVAFSVLVEGFAVGLVASVLGYLGGLVVALLLNFVLNAGGFGSGDTQLVLSFRSVLIAFAVGVGTTLLASIIPAISSTRIPPVAAMREGFRLSLGSTKFLGAVGGVMVVLGGAAIAWSLIASPDTLALFGALGVGALVVFVGAALLSAALAGPIARAIGLPFRAIYNTTGEMARQNAAREPNRTAFTAAALMIGLALVSMSLVVGTSFRSSFVKTLSTGITADWYVTTDSFFGFTPEVSTQLKQSPDFTAVTGLHQGPMQVDGSTKTFSSVDFSVVDELLELDIQEGGVTSDRGLMLKTDPAEELGISAGDTVTVTFQETGEAQLPVLAVYENSGVVGNWLIDEQTYQENFTDQNDFLVAAKSAPGVTPDQARSAIEQVIEPFPQLEAQDRDQFQATREAQLNGLLIVIVVFLLLAIGIATIGIVITLALSVFERTRELGLLRAVGMLRPQVRRMIRIEAVIVAVFGALMGILVGVIFGVALSLAIPDDVISTVEVPWIFLVVILLIAGILGVLAALYPAWRAGRLRILDAIATE